MTDYRRTEQELWDEDAIAEEDRRAQVVPKVAPVNDTAVPSRDSVESVARFIADPSLLAGPSAELRLDAPSRSLAALELLDAEDLDEAELSEVLAEVPAPPPPPRASLPPSSLAPLAPAPKLPSMMLGAQISTREDETERVTTIPKTHPLANSLAPGGSPLTLPPQRPRRALRAQVALGALALLALGASASRFLQSRGEHHAVSAARAPLATERDEVTSLEPTVAPSVTSLAPSQDAERAPGAASETSEASEGAPASVPDAPRPAPSASALPARPARDRFPALRRAADAREGEGAAPTDPPVHVAMGTVQLQPEGSAETQEIPAQPDRAQVIAALNALTDQLRECVGDEHGIADVTLTVRAPGIVSHALVEGPFAGSAKGSCIARMLRSAQLPRFAEPVVRIEYPFEL